MANFPPHPPTDGTTIAALIDQLAHEDSVHRQEARQKLGTMGSPAVPSLVECLYDPREHVRWEAAKTLQAIADPLTASALTAALEDDSEDVRWVAAEALVALKDAAVAPVLHALVRRAWAFGLCKGAHHVLHELAKKKRLHDVLAPVLTALGSLQPAVFAPPAALTALENWRASVANRANPGAAQ